jgi:peptidoglycan hydrolase-like protein with peptidoglycan-binding domain
VRRKIAVLAAAAAVVSAGITLVSPGQAWATSSCTNVTQVALVSTNTAAVPSIGVDTDQVNCDLQYGISNTAVADLQRSLNKCYGEGLTQDGIYGSQTKAAVENVQSVLGISVDGIYGPQTGTAMKWFDNQGIGCSKVEHAL